MGVVSWTGEEGLQRGCKFHCTELPWGDEAAVQRILARGVMFDTVLLSDVVYDVQCYEPLIDTLITLCPPELAARQRILIAYRFRQQGDSQFFAMLEVYFQVQSLSGLTPAEGVN